MNKTIEPYCIAVEESNVIVVVFGDELTELKGCEIDAGDAFSYIVGTDAWFEKEVRNNVPTLLAKSQSKEFLRIPLTEEIDKILIASTGLLVLFPKFYVKPEDIRKTANLDELRDWIDSEMGANNLEGAIFCYYSEEDRQKQNQV